jgi:hypothetical protein
VQPLPGAGARIHFQAIHLHSSCTLLYELQVQDGGAGSFATVRSCSFDGLARIDDAKCPEMPDEQTPLTTYYAADSLWRLRLSNPGGACASGEVMSLNTIYCYIDAPSPPGAPPTSPSPLPPPPSPPPLTAYNFFYMDGGRSRASDGGASTDASGSSTTKEVGRSDDAVITVLIIIIIVLPIALFLCAWTQSHLWAARHVGIAQAPTPAPARRQAPRTVPTAQRYQSLPRAAQLGTLHTPPHGRLQFKL